MPGGYKKINEYNMSLTQEQRKENARKARAKKTVKERSKKDMRSWASMIANAEIKDRELLEKIKGISDAGDDIVITGNAAVVSGIYDAAVAGNMQAVEKWQDLTAIDPNEKAEYRLPAELIGKDFVDINREIIPNKSYRFTGGRGSLKSSFISEKIPELIKNNPQLHACVIRKVGNTLRDSVYAQLVWSITALGLAEEFEFQKVPLQIVYKKTGQIIYFRGLDDPGKLKGIKPPFGYVGILWKEEVDQLSGPSEERSVNQSILRGGPIAYDFASYNPPKSKLNWVNKQALELDETRIVHVSNYKNAPPQWLGQKFLEDAEHLKMVNPAAYENEYMGIANGDGGNVFDNIEIREISDEEIARMDRIYQGVDWGWFPDPYAFLRTGYSPAQERIYLIDEFYGNKMSNDQTAFWIKEKHYDDYIIICDSEEPKSVINYRDLGLPARGAVKGPGSVDFGFKWLQKRTLVIDQRRTPKAYEEIIGYEYLRDKDGNVISGYPDKNDHAISALRYAYEPLFNKRGSIA